ncbi:MAG: hypothetical protein IIA44_05690 [Acidobacteria bacterium]|nr:hypothetical protein [Acidobacteriota bacterium]
MMGSDLYVFWDRFKGLLPSVKMQQFGLSIYEALLSGCVCVGVKHPGTTIVSDYVQLVTDQSEALDAI